MLHVYPVHTDRLKAVPLSHKTAAKWPFDLQYYWD